MSKFISNSFQIPNAIVDEFLSHISGNAFKCYALIARQTTGWQKQSDRISVSQFMDKCGIKNRKTAFSCLAELEEVQLIKAFKNNGEITEFSLNFEFENTEIQPVPKNNTSTKNSLEPVPKNNTSTRTKNWYPTKDTIKNNITNTPLNPPLGETQGDSVAVLNYLNDRLAELSKAVEQPLPKFQAVPNTLKNIKARLSENSRVECETVVDYLVAKWGRDGKMREYLSPKTIFRASNFADYLPKSTAWAANGKPVCVNGKWVSVAELLRVENTPTVDEVRNGYLKYLSLGRGYFKAWQFATVREKALYWAIITVKNKRPLERDTLFACKQSIEEVMAKIDTLKIPQIGENQ